MTYNAYKLPKITVDFGDRIAHTEIKSVKEYAKQQKANMEDYLIESLKQSEAKLEIHFSQVFIAEATFYNDYEPPVFTIKAEAWNRVSHEDVYVHFYVQPDHFASLFRMYEYT